MAATPTCRLTLASERDEKRRSHSNTQGSPGMVLQHRSVNTQLLLPPAFCPRVSIPEPRLLLLPLTHLYSSTLIFLLSVSDLVAPVCPPSIYVHCP